MLRYCFLFIILVALNTIGSGQTARDLLKFAENAYEAGEFHKALDYYERYEELRPDDKDSWEGLAKTYYHINFLDKAVGKMSAIQDAKIKTSNELLFFKADLLHHQGKWEESISFYKEYLQKSGGTESYYHAAIEGIKGAAQGLKLDQSVKKAYVENLGSKVNTISDEFLPVLSPNNNNKIYYSSSRKGNKGGKRNYEGLLDPENGKYKSDIFFSVKETGFWQYGERIENLINTGKDEILLNFSTDGKIMYFFRGKNEDKGKLYTDTFNFQSAPPLNREEVILPFNPNFGDKDLFIIDDNLFLFSAVHPSGYGGYDLYLAVKKDGNWSEVRNLGPEINSIYDERCPFITKDIGQLIFSSNRPSSIGGYDFYISRWDHDFLKFATPENLGTPLSSAGDDMHFTLKEDGTTAFFNSDRKTDNLGKRDIYSAYFKNPIYTGTIASERRKNEFVNRLKIVKIKEDDVSNEEEVLKQEEVKISSLLFDDDRVLSAQNIRTLDYIATKMKEDPQSKILFKVYDAFDGPVHLDLFFTSKKGMQVANYLKDKGIDGNRIQVTAIGSGYPIAYPKTPTLSAASVDYINKRIDIYLFSDKFKYLESIPSAPRGYSDDRFQIFNTKYSGLTYRIQIIAASQMYNSEYLTKYDYPLVDQNGNQDIMKYTVGMFKTYQEARKFRKEIIENGLRGAYIVPYINGFRKTNYELEQLKTEYPDIQNYLSLSK